jgi:hypothetical protein
MEITDVALAQQSCGDQSAPLIEGCDFYFEHGRFVLTESFLQRRGACCDNGCRHCPYRAVPLA